jgi:spermidine/putrescine-binding protein
MWSVCSTTKKPVLAHLFLNYMLDNGVAYSNFVNFNGYQPPAQPRSIPTRIVKKA